MVSVTRKEIITLDDTRSSFILSAVVKRNLAEVGSEDLRECFTVLFSIVVFKFSFQITQTNWLTQQGKAEELTTSLILHQGVVETHGLDGGAMEIRSLFYPIWPL